MLLIYDSQEALQYLKNLMQSQESFNFCTPLEKFMIYEMKKIHSEIKQLSVDIVVDESAKIIKLENLYGRLEAFCKVLIFIENDRRSR
jgi:hypothetical protein